MVRLVMNNFTVVKLELWFSNDVIKICHIQSRKFYNHPADKSGMKIIYVLVIIVSCCLLQNVLGAALPDATLDDTQGPKQLFTTANASTQADNMVIIVIAMAIIVPIALIGIFFLLGFCFCRETCEKFIEQNQTHRTTVITPAFSTQFQHNNRPSTGDGFLTGATIGYLAGSQNNNTGSSNTYCGGSHNAPSSGGFSSSGTRTVSGFGGTSRR